MSEETPSKSTIRSYEEKLSSEERLSDFFDPSHHDAIETFRSGQIIEESDTDGAASSDDKLIALLCYWTQLFMPFVMPLIVLLSESGKRRSYQRYHAMHSLGLIIGSLVISVGSVMAIGILIGPFALCLVPIVYAMSVISLLVYGWQALKGRRFTIPFLSRWMSEQGWL
ncbi:MAG: DUF4870 domain-containing protein [Chloroflexota bacterium]